MAITDAKLERILHAKAPFTPEEREQMTDLEGWAWVYRNRGTTIVRVDQICFTGFTAAECESLHARAAATGWLKPVGTVTAKLAFLCTGAVPGSAKLAKAARVGAEVIDVTGFDRLVGGGELPPRG